MSSTKAASTEKPNRKPKRALPIDTIKHFFAYDAISGQVTWKAKPAKQILVGARAGCVWKDARNRYIRIVCTGKWIFAHHVAFVLTYGRYPDGDIDHINGIGTDNRLTNLREVSHAENMRNQRRSSANTSGCMGVDFHNVANKWRARIIVDKKEMHLGVFDTKTEAVAARKAAELHYGFHPNHGDLRPNS